MTDTTGSNTAATEGWDGHNVIAVSFEDDRSAYKALTSLKELDSQQRLRVAEAVVVERGEDGQVVEMSDQPSPDAGHALVIVELAEVGERRTEMRFEERGSLSPAQTSAARYGWSRFFDRLAARLAAG